MIIFLSLRDYPPTSLRATFPPSLRAIFPPSLRAKRSNPDWTPFIDRSRYAPRNDEGLDYSVI